MSREKHGIAMLSAKRLLGIKRYQTIWLMGHKLRKAMEDRDAQYKLGGLLEVDDSYFGAKKPGKRGRGAFGKGKVVIAVETRNNKSCFAIAKQVKSVSKQEIEDAIKHRINDGAKVLTDGWRSYDIILR
jgi:hypothetical protein